jgi:hypothetical protein
MKQEETLLAYRKALVGAKALSHADKRRQSRQHRSALTRLRRWQQRLGFDPLKVVNPDVGVFVPDPEDRMKAFRFRQQTLEKAVNRCSEDAGFLEEDTQAEWAAENLARGLVSRRYDTRSCWGPRYFPDLQSLVAWESILSIAMEAVGRVRGLDLLHVKAAMLRLVAACDVERELGPTPAVLAEAMEAFGSMPQTQLDIRSLRDEAAARWIADCPGDPWVTLQANSHEFDPRLHLHRLLPTEVP